MGLLSVTVYLVEIFKFIFVRDSQVPLQAGCGCSVQNGGKRVKRADGTEPLVEVPEEFSTDNRFADFQEMIDYLKQYKFTYENVVFEGGGNKGIAYCGAMQVLEALDITKNLKRFAGASAGSGVAMMAALGYNANEITYLLVRDCSEANFLDSRMGKASLLYNLVMHHGWHPGKRLQAILESYVEQATGNRHMTFEQLYRERGKELCVVVTNITTMSAEYFHPKTTPDVAIALAVRMSMSLPGIFQPVKLCRHGTSYIYVDGGLLCNYPVHAFDGWFLSMDPKDSFLKRLDVRASRRHSTNQRYMFGTQCRKTLGMMLYSGNEAEFMKSQFEERLSTVSEDGSGEVNFHFKNPRPDTRLARENGPAVDKFLRKERKRQRIFDAAMHFWQALRECDVDQSDTIDKEELKNALSNGRFSEQDAKLLFGKNYSVDEIFEEMDVNRDGQINWQEFIQFVERRSVAFLCYIQKLSMRDVHSFGEFLSAVIDTLEINVKQVYMKTSDADRTIGINTDYIQTTDFRMEVEDKEFLVRQGAIACLHFLKDYTEREYM